MYAQGPAVCSPAIAKRQYQPWSISINVFSSVGLMLLLLLLLHLPLSLPEPQGYHAHHSHLLSVLFCWRALVGAANVWSRVHRHYWWMSTLLKGAFEYCPPMGWSTIHMFHMLFFIYLLSWTPVCKILFISTFYFMSIIRVTSCSQYM